MYAIVATGGKQLKVAAGDVVSVEKLDAPVGETVKFDVIFLANEGEITVDSDSLAAATVTGEIVEHFKGEKAIVFKFKKRKGYKRLKGHRQNLTRVRITDVVAGESAPKKKAAAPKAEKVEKADAEAAPKKAAPKKKAAEGTAEKAAPKKAAPKKAAAPKAEKADAEAAPKKAAAPKKKAAPKKAAEKVEEPVAEVATEDAETTES